MLDVNFQLGTKASKPLETMVKECSADPGNKHEFQVLIEGRYLGDGVSLLNPAFPSSADTPLCGAMLGTP